VRAVQRCCEGLHAVDPMRVATRTISGLYDGASTRELDELSIRTAALLIGEEPEYGRLAARLLANYIAKEVSGQEIYAFSQSVRRGHDVGLINERLLELRAGQRAQAQRCDRSALDLNFDYFGLRTLYDRYLLRHPHTRKVIETPQQFFLRIACALSEDVPRHWRCTAHGQPGLPAVRRRCSTRAPATSSCRRASCSTRRRIRWSRSTTSTATSPSCRSSPAASA
jgi:ribonucleoside-diphosphate reductase alpha chain